MEGLQSWQVKQLKPHSNAQPCSSLHCSPHEMGPQSPLDITSLSLKWSHKGQHREPHVELPAPGAKDSL